MNYSNRLLYIIWAIALLVILGITGFFVSKKTFVPEKIHAHAGFVVFENNKQLDFSDNKHMKVEPCTDTGHDENHSEEAIQVEKAHLHDNDGDVVHMEREGATWKDMFTNSKIAIDFSKTTGYINGQKVDNYLNQRINSYDSLVVFVGDNDPKLLEKAVTKERIREGEKKSEGC